MRKKFKKNNNNKTDEFNSSVVEPIPDIDKISEQHCNQEHLFQEHGCQAETSLEEKPLPKKNDRKLNKNLYYFAGAFVFLLLIWYFVFPFVVNSGIAKEHLELILGNKLNLKVETGKVTLSNWGKTLKVHANSVNFMDPDDDSVVAYVDRIHFEFSPLYILFGEKYLKNVKVSRLDIQLPAISIQKYMVSKGYLSHVFYKDSQKFKDDSMSFQNIDIKVEPVDSKLQINAIGDCEITFFKDSAFEFAGVYNPGKDHLKINCFHFWGNRIIDVREFKSNNIVRSAIKTPVSIDVSGVISKQFIDLPEIHLMVDSCQAIVNFKRLNGSILFNIDVNNQDFPNVGRLFNTRSFNEELKGVDLKLEAYTSKNDELISKGTLSVRKGTLRGVPFENANLKFASVNDRITLLDSSTHLWNGYASINLLEKNIKSKNGSAQNLVGDIFASRIDLNECLSSIEKIPALTGGELTLFLNFDFENLGIKEFISKKLPEFNFERGSGTVILSNAYLSHFSNPEWKSSPEIPKIIKDYFGIAESLTEASVSIPLLNKFIKELALNKPRTLKTSVVIENGKLSTPKLLADTPIGELIAKGSCNSNNVMNYKIQLKLDKNIYNKYKKSPIFSLFSKNEMIELPIILSGKLGHPDVKLNLTPKKRAELEKILTEIISENIYKSMKNKNKKIKKSDEIDGRIKSTIRSIINKLL